MSGETNVTIKTPEETTQNAVPSGPPPVPPQDLSLNLDLYNYDSPDAQSCPYVLTSPRSLEACSRVGIKPVDLLHKTLAEFSDDVEPDKPLDEIVKLYDEHEQQRIILLQKCQAEREFLIWRSTSKRRSHSLSPCRRSRLHKQQKSKDLQSHRTISQSFRNAPRRKSSDDLLSTSEGEGRSAHLQHSRSSSVKNLHRSGQRPISWSTPASPYYQGSRNLFVRITSPVVCAKLQTFPKAKMRLPPKDMKILEMILQKYEKLEEEEERRARAQRRWDKEKEIREKKKEEAEMERWKNLALKQKRSSSEERARASSDKGTPTHSCSRYPASEKDDSERSLLFQKRHSFKAAKNQTKSFEDQNPKRNYASERLSRYEAEQKLKAIQLKEEQVRKRRMEIIQKRDDVLKRSAEEFKVKLFKVKTNQQELDKAMEQWQQQVICYQEAANMRAAERAAQTFEERRRKAMSDRLSKQEEHKKNMRKIEAEDFAKLQEMMAKLRSKDERCKAFKEEKTSSIEQSRQLAQAASDLRDLIRQRLDKDSFVKRSQQAALESRLLSIEPRISQSKENPEEKT
ncbi:coiled-coil domain-containing protein 177-like isoform X2 [Stegodyphus dumicola]|uniref:coiled-coil domain-containing protein 177-like isoform X2 n=1 Tax=Stegodyphus dumicola TaxID=202533 RepID=UPI0015AFC6AE|nr:coiled-coil domain-containing protein 177-like isoform X2 [Stegodyphus dumicola]